MKRGIGRDLAIKVMNNNLEEPLPVSKKQMARLALYNPANIPMYLSMDNPKMFSKAIPLAAAGGAGYLGAIGLGIGTLKGNPILGGAIGATVGSLAGGALSYLISKKSKDFYRKMLLDAGFKNNRGADNE